MSKNRSRIKRSAVGLLGLLIVLGAVAAPLTAAFEPMVPTLADGLPQPEPLLWLGLALCALGAWLRRRGEAGNGPRG